jgi:sugar lactone lactonase YvrE
LPEAAANMVVDANNKIWCSAGKKILRINPTTKAIETRLTVGTSTTKKPLNLTLNANKTTIFFEYSFQDANDGFKQKGDIPN